MNTYIGTYISMSIANNIIYSIAEHEHNFATDLHVALTSRTRLKKIWDCYLYMFVVYCSYEQQIAGLSIQITDKQQINNR